MSMHCGTAYLCILPMNRSAEPVGLNQKEGNTGYVCACVCVCVCVCVCDTYHKHMSAPTTQCGNAGNHPQPSLQLTNVGLDEKGERGREGG